MQTNNLSQDQCKLLKNEAKRVLEILSEYPIRGMCKTTEIKGI
jgi:predicted heme/steroid binding protein